MRQSRRSCAGPMASRRRLVPTPNIGGARRVLTANTKGDSVGRTRTGGRACTRRRARRD
jgi:hypothetical protein